MEGRRKNRSLTIRLFVSVFAVIVLLNLVSIIAALRLSASSRDSVVREYRYVEQLYINQLDRELSQAQLRMYNLSRSNSYVLAMLNGTQDAYESLRTQTEINNEMNEWLAQFPLINGYYIYDPQTGLLIICGNDSEVMLEISQEIAALTANASASQWKLTELSEVQILAFDGFYRETIYGAWVQPDRLINEWGIKGNTGEQVPMLTGDIDNYENVSLTQGNPEKNTSFLSERAGQEGNSYQLVAADTPADASCIDVPSTQAAILLRASLPSGWSFLPVGVRILLIASICLLLALPVAWLSLNRLVLGPLRELADAIQHIESGDLNFRITERATSSEFDRLNVQFNNSLDQLANMRLQVYESQLEKERIYVNYLSQQMQPHFVLNTLNLIFSMEPEEYDLIQETVACLSDYYRYIAHIQDPLVPVSAELAHVENYFKLQQIRYPEMFFYQINCPEELKGVRIPPILIQTFAENAIKHSMNVGSVNRVEITLEAVPDGGVISPDRKEPHVAEDIVLPMDVGDAAAGLRIAANKSSLHIRIRDHGKGYPEEVLARIKRFRETGEPQEGLGLGIQNTIERIRLIYQSLGEIELTNAPDGGAQIDLMIPM